jgi:hypothetical protein
MLDAPLAPRSPKPLHYEHTYGRVMCIDSSPCETTKVGDGERR